jgi:hypothetical protein
VFISFEANFLFFFAACKFLYHFQLFVQACARKCSVILAEYFLKIFYQHSASSFWKDRHNLLFLNKWNFFASYIRKRKSCGYCSCTSLVSIWFNRLFDINRHIKVHIGEIKFCLRLFFTGFSCRKVFFYLSCTFVLLWESK